MIPNSAQKEQIQHRWAMSPSAMSRIVVVVVP
jgi:hypothetical protein